MNNSSQSQSRSTSEKMIETTTVKKIRKVLDGIARQSQFGFIFGPSGRGKTFTAKNWIERNGNAAYIRIQTGTTQGRLRKQISMALFGHENGSFSAILKYLMDRPGFTIVIDEAAHLITETSTASSAKNMDFIRDIYDEVKENGGACGVCFIFTHCNIDRLISGRLSEFLRQFVSRMDNHLNIPEKISRAYEIRPAVSAFVENPSEDLIEAAWSIASNACASMRSLYRYLKIAQKVCAKTQQSISGTMLKEIQKQYESGDYPDE